MKFYRMEVYRLAPEKDGGEHEGTAWFTSRKSAHAGRADWLRGGDFPGDITEVEIQPTMGGILRALNRFAAHPDNG